MKLWKKMLLGSMLLFAVGTSVDVSAQESATPQVVDQIVRKLSYVVEG